MKEFIKNKTVTYNLMSFTGFKALVMFALLTEGPKSYNEIADYMEQHPYLREKISIDTMRVYINSLKRIGCEIKRTKGEDKISRYSITAHPFELSATQEQLKILTTAYKNITKNISIEEILYLDNFFEKIGKYIKNPDFTNGICANSILKGINKSLLQNLSDCCNKKLQIVMKYNSPKSGIKNVEILTDKIEIANNKIYLYGINNEYKEYTGFLINRIIGIDKILINKTLEDKAKSFTVTYKLKSKTYEPEENEKLTEKNDDFKIIQVTTKNKFLLTQKLLSYGPLCTIIEPEEYKTEFINLLKDIKAGYYCD